VGAGAANLNFNGGTLRVTNALATTIGNVVMTMNAGATFDIGSSITFSTGANALLAGTGAQVLTKTGAGTLTIPGAAAYTGATDIRDGALQLTGSLSSSTTLNLGNGTTSGKLILGNSGAANSATIAGLTTTGTGTANAIVGGGNASVSTLTVNLASGTNTFAGRIGGTGTNENAIALTKTGNGTLTLSATNTYTGATNVNLGKLQIGAGGTTGSIASGSAVSIASGATAEWFSSSTGVAVSNGISGSGTLSFLGTGIIGQSEYSGLSGASTFTGAVSVDKARLQITAANQLSSASGISVLNGGQLFLNTTTNDFDTTTYTYDRNLTMTGNGWNETGGPFGALRMRGVTLSGNVSLTGNSRIETFGPSDSFVSTISGEISGDFGITTAGNRTLTLSADNIYTGPTTVSSGKLVINGSTSTGLVTVNSGATLGGTGTVGGAATINGALAPGNSIGTLNFSQTLTLAGTSDFEIDPTLGLGLNRASDLANVFGAITYGGILNVLYGGANTNFTNGMVFNLFDGASFSGTFSTLNLPDLTGTGLSWQNNLATNGTLTVVPEPAAALLGGIGLVVLLRRRRS
jgi:autotransporter-associated beta strand protein